MSEPQPLDAAAFLAKAAESLQGAESEYTAGRFNNCVNRCYYACFQAAVAALIQAGVPPRSGMRQWGHDYVQAQFSGELINRRKRYPSQFRDLLPEVRGLRQIADYQSRMVGRRAAGSALRSAQRVVDSVREVLGRA